jgi:alginate O-acetyltransferase complex protein AlgI
MSFQSAPYALLLSLTFVAAWVLWSRERARHGCLLAASYWFYGTWDWRFLGLILFSTLLDYVVGRALGAGVVGRALGAGVVGRALGAGGAANGVRSGARRALLAVSLVGNLGLLGFYKYYDFFVREAAAALQQLGLALPLHTLELVLPVGISFYTFQTLSYTIDVYRGQLAPERSLLRFALFVAFFPQLVAGPIVRAADFLPQLQRRPSLDLAAVRSGLALIFAGLAKKLLLADVIGAELVDPAWEHPASFGGLATLLAIYGYAFQIYGDFSGYSDIAIGSARLLGFELGENFRAPYRATGPRDFWRRWHISLSTWLRDYLYVPLGGNRRGALRTQWNLALTMLLGGLWHGASWMFVLWGAYHGLLLAMERALPAPSLDSALGRWTARVVTFHLVCLGWVFFRSETPAQAWAVLTSLFDPRGAEELAPLALGSLGLAFLLHLPAVERRHRWREAFARWPAPVQGVVYAALLGLFLSASQLQVPFLYFQF